jgi:hypothetical protein
MFKRRWAGQNGLNLTVVADQEAREMLELSIAAHLNSVDVRDQSIGGGGGGEARADRERG